MKAMFCQLPWLRLVALAVAAAAGFASMETAVAQKAYIAISPVGSSPFAVSIIDTATEKLDGKITVEGAPGTVALTPDGAKILVHDGEAHELLIINTTGYAVEARLPVQYVSAIAVTPDGSKAYLVADGIQVVDLARNEIVKRINYPGNGQIAITPDGTKAYVTDGQYTVAAIDTITDTVVAKIRIPGPGGNSISWPIAIAFLPDSSRAYVANYQDNDVSVIDTETDKIVATIPTGREPESIAVTSDGKKVYVAQSFQSQISVIDPATNKVTSNVKVKHPYGISLTPDGKEAYVTSDNALIVLNTSTLTMTKHIPLGGQPNLTNVAIGPRPSPLSAVTFPASGVAKIGGTVTTRAVLTNNGQRSMTNCGAKIIDPSGQGVKLSYRALDAEGQPEGVINQPVTIAKGGTQAFRLAFSGNAVRTGGPIPVIFDCNGITRAPVVADLNTFDLSVTAEPTPNILLSKPGPDTVVSVPVNGNKAFIVDATNAGLGGLLTVSADSGNAPLPVSMTVCPAKPGMAECQLPAVASFADTFAAKQSQSLLITIHAANYIASAPATSRIFVRFKDKNGVLRGLTSVAVQTSPINPKNPPVPGPTYSGSFSGSDTSYFSECDFSDTYAGTVKISLAPGSRTGEASVQGTLTRTAMSNPVGYNCSVGNGTQQLASSGPITLSGARITWAAVVENPYAVFFTSNFSGTISGTKITGTLTEQDSAAAGSAEFRVTLPIRH